MTEGQTAYREYLNSPLWHAIANQRLALDNHECVLCGRPAQHVHHRRYPRNWGEETINDLASLCSECHARYHAVNQAMYDLPKPASPTRRMYALKKEMRQAESEGNEERQGVLLRQYVNLRRAQVAG